MATQTKSMAQIVEQKRQDEFKITQLMAQTYHFTLTYRDGPNKTQRIHRANCNFCHKKFLATSIGLPINERMIQHFEQFHDKGRLQNPEAGI